MDHHDWEALARTCRSVREYLDTLDEAAWDAASEMVLKFISQSDPAAQWTGAHKDHAFFAYVYNYLIDLKTAVIVDAEVTRAIRHAEVGAARIARDVFAYDPETDIYLCPTASTQSVAFDLRERPGRGALDRQDRGLCNVAM